MSLETIRRQLEVKHPATKSAKTEKQTKGQATQGKSGEKHQAKHIAERTCPGRGGAAAS